MAPEVQWELRGIETRLQKIGVKSQEKSDIWAAGVTILETLLSIEPESISKGSKGDETPLDRGELSRGNSFPKLLLL